MLRDRLAVFASSGAPFELAFGIAVADCARNIESLVETGSDLFAAFEIEGMPIITRNPPSPGKPGAEWILPFIATPGILKIPDAACIVKQLPKGRAPTELEIMEAWVACTPR